MLSVLSDLSVALAAGHTGGLDPQMLNRVRRVAARRPTNEGDLALVLAEEGTSLGALALVAGREDVWRALGDAPADPWLTWEAAVGGRTPWAGTATTVDAAEIHRRVAAAAGLA